jgi:hypothetical protein
MQASIGWQRLRCWRCRDERSASFSFIALNEPRPVYRGSCSDQLTNTMLRTGAGIGVPGLK